MVLARKSVLAFRTGAFIAEWFTQSLLSSGVLLLEVALCKAVTLRTMNAVLARCSPPFILKL